MISISLSMMASHSLTEKKLLEENAELRLCLAEAQERLRAMHCEIDGIGDRRAALQQTSTLQNGGDQSNRFHEEILTQINDAVIAIDLEERVTYFNAAAERQYRVRSSDVLGRKLDEIYTRHWPSAEAEATAKTAVHELGEWRGETIQRTHDGRELHIESNVTQLMDHNGATIGLLAVIRDITERKRNERLLTEIQQRYAGIVESAMDAIITIDADHQILVFNAAAEKMLGCSAHNAIGRPLADFIPHWLDLIAATSACPLDSSGINTAKAELPGVGTGLRKTSEEFPIEVSFSQIGTGVDQTFTAILRDITERQRGELAMQEELTLQDQLAKVAASVPGVICSFRLSSDGSASMPYASQAFESLYGIRHESVANDFSPIFARIHPDDIGHVNDTITESARTQQPWQDMFRYHHPTKGEIWLEGHSMPRCEPDGGMLWHGYLQDITARKLAESELQERENKLQLIMDSTPALISYLDTDFRYVRVNKAYENWFCQSHELMLGHEARVIIGEKAWSLVRPFLERARSGERVYFDYQIPYGTSKPRWVQGTYIPDKDENGIVKGIVIHVIDIDDRKQAEQKIAVLNQNLQCRVEEMQVIFNTAPIGLAIANDATGLHIQGNPNYEQLLGLRPDSDLSEYEQSSVPYRVFQNNRELDIEELPMQRAVHGETLSNQVLEILHADGRLITLLSHAAPLFDERGVPRGAIGSFQDISDLKRAEAMVSKSEAFVRGVLDSLPEHIVVIDNDGVVTVANEPWERFAVINKGTPSAVSLGANYLEVCRRASTAGDLHAREALEGLESLLAGHRDEFIMEYPCPTPNCQMWFLLYAKRMMKGHEGIILSHVNITERKRAEKALLKAQARLNLVIEEVQAGYWDWNLKKGKVFVSSEWKRQIGFEDNELPSWGEQKDDRLHPADRALVTTATENFIAGHSPIFELDFRLRHKDNSYRWIHCRGALLHDSQNQPIRMLGLNLDITDYKKTREINEQRDKMEHAFRLHVASQTAAAIAHELNQPLTAISYYADVALQLLQSGNQNPQKLFRILESTSQQAQRAGQVIRQLMTVLHKGETLTESLDINDSVKKALNFIKSSDSLSHVNFKLNLSADLPPVAANGLQIQKILNNLLRNSLESIQESEVSIGIVTVTTTASASDPAIAQVTVSDNGKGVQDIATLRDLFQPFHTTKATGLGMGLAISRSLIEAHGGKMWAEQNTDAGIRIHFTLPFLQ